MWGSRNIISWHRIKNAKAASLFFPLFKIRNSMRATSPNPISPKQPGFPRHYCTDAAVIKKIYGGIRIRPMDLK